MTATINAVNAMEISLPQLTLDAACEAETRAINEIAQSGDIELMLMLEYQLQVHDLSNYARTEQESKNIRRGIRNFTAGVTNYERLTERPQEYREQASGYTDGHIDKKLGVPMDGMRTAINGQLTRLQQRKSLMTSNAEKELLAARYGLLAAIKAEYSRRQHETLHRQEAGEAKKSNGKHSNRKDEKSK